MNTTTLKDTVMSDTNWQLKEGDQFESRRMLSLQIADAVKPRMVGGFISAPDTQACYTAAGHIEAQQQRIEALERELAEVGKDADLLDIVRTMVCTADRIMSLPNSENYPSPLSNFSPLMIAARQACIDRGFTAGGLSIDAAMKEQA